MLEIKSQNKDADEAAAKFLVDKETYKYPGAKQRARFIKDVGDMGEENAKNQERKAFKSKYLDNRNIDNIMNGGQ